MSTTKDNSDFDYHAYAKEHDPDPTLIRRGDAMRHRQRRKELATKHRITIRIDQDILERFKALTPEGRGYQRLINQALREWLTARDAKTLILQMLEAEDNPILDKLKQRVVEELKAAS